MDIDNISIIYLECNYRTIKYNVTQNILFHKVINFLFV